MNDFFRKELDRHDKLPKGLLSVRSLPDMVHYILRQFQNGVNQPSQSQIEIGEPSRKRSNAELVQSDYESDSTGTSESPPQATNVQDLPGYTHPPPTKRRKIYDPSMIMGNKKHELYSLVNIGKENAASTPLKIMTTPQDPTSSKYLPTSASKIVDIGGKLSESIIATGLHEVFAQTINNAFEKENCSSDQLPDKMPDIVTLLQECPTFGDIVKEDCSGIYEYHLMDLSSSPSKGQSETDDDVIETTDDRQLDTPVPAESTKTGRYELRSHRKSTPTFNTSIETKKKKNAKAQIISNEKIDLLSQSTIKALRNEQIITIDSDSEGAVTTTSQQQFQPIQPIQQNNGQPLYFEWPAESGQYFMTYAMSGKSNLIVDQIQSSNSMAHGVDQPQFSIVPNQTETETIDLDNYQSIELNALKTNQIVLETEFGLRIENASDRLIVVNSSEVDKEGSQPVQEKQQTSSAPEEPPKNEAEANSNEQTNNKSNFFAQFKQTSDQKIITPKQSIKANMPSSSRSLSTPRNKNPVVRVLNYNTPSRFHKLPGIMELNVDTSKFCTDTPQNRSITSSMPSSAPPKINSAVQSTKESAEKAVESTSAEVFNPMDENTVVSAEGETPKVRKTNRRSCRRTISSHKELNAEENEKRLKRVATTKKKICIEDGDSNGSQKNEKQEEIQPASKEDALAEWQKIKSARMNPELFEQNLREQNSKKQDIERTTGRKKRANARGSKKKPVSKAKPAPKDALNDSNVDISMNSSIDVDTLNSTQTNLEARILEENLKSAKKMTPIKQRIAHKSAKKKTPIGKLQIKLMPSPKNKLKRQKNAKRDSAGESTSKEAHKKEPCASSMPASETAQQQQSESDPKSAMLATENTNDDLEVAQNLIKMQEVILQQENDRKMAQSAEIQSDSVSMSEPTKEVPIFKTSSELIPTDQFSLDLLKMVHQPNLSMSALLDTPFKENILLLPKTPGFNAIQPSQQTP